MEIEKSINDLLLKWSNARINAEASSAIYEAEDGYHAGISDTLAGCIKDLKMLVARSRLKLA